MNSVSVCDVPSDLRSLCLHGGPLSEKYFTQSFNSLKARGVDRGRLKLKKTNFVMWLLLVEMHVDRPAEFGKKTLQPIKTVRVCL